MNVYYSFMNEAPLNDPPYYVVFYELAPDAKTAEDKLRLRCPQGIYTPLMTEGPFRDLIDSLEIQDYPQWETFRFFAFDPITGRFKHIGTQTGRTVALIKAKYQVSKSVRVVLDGNEATSSLYDLEYAKVNSVPRLWSDWLRLKRKP